MGRIGLCKGWNHVRDMHEIPVGQCVVTNLAGHAWNRNCHISRQAASFYDMS